MTPDQIHLAWSRQTHTDALGRTFVRRSAVERLFERLQEQPSGCWVWTGAMNDNGYGKVWGVGRLTYAHRLAYELLIADVPDGLDLDHLCRNRRCANPWHLEPVSRQENLRRGKHWWEAA